MRGLRTLAAVLILALVPPAGLAYPDGARKPPPGQWTTGRLLVASETMPGNFFSETVVLMLRHDEDGAFGLIVNRPSGKAKLGDALKLFGREASALPDPEPVLGVHNGGPVEARRMFMLHSAEAETDSPLTVKGRYTLSAPDRLLDAIAKGQGPRQGFLVFGYSGWSPKQLEGEIARGDWLIVDADDDTVFGPDNAGKWKRLVGKRGVDL
jgi:putative transcriptional regulator